MTLDQILVRILDFAPGLAAIAGIVGVLTGIASTRSSTKLLKEARRQSEERINLEAALRGRLVQAVSKSVASAPVAKNSHDPVSGEIISGLSPELRNWMAHRGEAIESGLQTVVLPPDGRKES